MEAKGLLVQEAEEVFFPFRSKQWKIDLDDEVGNRVVRCE